jgi:hypothetical protein
MRDLRFKVLKHNSLTFSVVTSESEVQENCLTFEDGTHRLSRNVGMELPFYAS